jgi:hypothetical protein
MGHDFLKYEDRHVHLHDAVIELLHHFISEELRTPRPPELRTDDETLNSLRSFFGSWQYAGPGVWLGTDFTLFVKGQPPRRDLLLSLLGRVMGRVKQFGTNIPLGYLTDHELGFMGDYPADKVITALSKVNEMLSRG